MSQPGKLERNAAARQNLPTSRALRPAAASTPVRAPLLLILVGMIIGLQLARLYSAPLPILLGGALLGSASALSWARRPQRATVWRLCFVGSAALTFWAYGQMRLPARPPPLHISLPAREARLTLELQRILQAEDRYGQTSGLARVLNPAPHTRLSSGDRVYFRLKQPPAAPIALQPGLQFAATGILTPIGTASRSAQSSDFDAYLRNHGVHYRFTRGSGLSVVAAAPPFARFCSAMNERFQRSLRLGAPADFEAVNIYVAMLLGRKNELTDAQRARFRATGTMHFFAISGLHIGVIASVIAQGLVLCRVPHALSPLIGLPLVYLYVAITGAAPSAVRAFLMASLFWASFACQRQRSAYAALINSAVLVLMLAPQQLWSIGFQLSYAVVLSILLFGLPLNQILRQRCRPYRWLPPNSRSPAQTAWLWLFDQAALLFAISASAWLASTPLSAGLFGVIVPGAIPLNMLLVNLAALVLVGGVLSLASASLWLPGLAALINHSAWLVLSAMEQLIRIGSQIRGASIDSADFPPTLGYLSLATYLASLLWLHQKPQRLNSGGLLLPPLAMLCPLLVGWLAR